MLQLALLSRLGYSFLPPSNGILVNCVKSLGLGNKHTGSPSIDAILAIFCQFIFIVSLIARFESVVVPVFVFGRAISMTILWSVTITSSSSNIFTMLLQILLISMRSTRSTLFGSWGAVGPRAVCNLVLCFLEGTKSCFFGTSFRFLASFWIYFAKRRGLLILKILYTLELQLFNLV